MFAFPNDLLTQHLHRKGDSHPCFDNVCMLRQMIRSFNAIVGRNTPSLEKEGMCVCECIYMSDRDQREHNEICKG